MKEIVVKLSDQEYKAFEYVALSPEEWAKNAVSNRARQATDEITEKAFDPKDDTVSIKEADIPKGMPRIVQKATKIDKNTKEELIGKATLKTAKQRNEEVK